MDNYYISGVWKDNSKITHVMLHESLPNSGFTKGEKTAVEEVIKLLKLGYKTRVMTWPYNGSKWQLGPEVEVVELKGIEFLRTVSNETIKDNLDNLISMSAFL